MSALPSPNHRKLPLSWPLLTRLVHRAECLDPRVKLLTVLWSNALLLFSVSHLLFVLVLALAVVILAAGGYYRTLGRSLILVSLFTGIWALSVEFSGVFGVASFGYLAFWLARFTVAYMIGDWFARSTSLSRLLEALGRCKVPAGALISFAVLIRFLPVVIGEFRAVYLALKLRGYASWQALKHPLRFFTQLMVPSLTALSRAGDELSAAALTRGLGYTKNITQLYSFKLRPLDVMLILYLLSCTGIGLWEVLK